MDGLTVPLISRQDLIDNKKQVGRLPDLADAEELERSNDERTRHNMAIVMAR